MYHVLVSSVCIIAAYKYGDWRNWEKYQSTILYFIVGDLTYNFLTYNYSLWEYQSVILNHTFTDLLIATTTVPAALLIFLYHFPKQRIKKFLYIIAWVLVSVIVELLSYYLGYFGYYHGWSIGWTFVHNIFMFSLLQLHQKRPLLTYFFSGIAAFTVLFLFDVPFYLMK